MLLSETYNTVPRLLTSDSLSNRLRLLRHLLTHMDENAATANYGQYRPLEKLNGRESPRGSEGKTGRQAWLSLASLIGQFHHHGNSLAEGHIINSGRQAKAFLTTQPLHSPN